MASKKRTRRPSVGRSQVEAEALSNALAERSVMNYEAIIEGFSDKGIPVEEIVPRENVFTYNAWRALGRQVRKGEHGVPVVTWLTSKGGSGSKTEGEGTDGSAYKFPRTVRVFHVTQTDPVQPTSRQTEAACAT